MEASKLTKPQLPPFELSLRIRHPSVDPAELSRELALDAEHSFRAGEPRRSRGDASPASVYAESYWLGTLDPTSWPADAWFSGHADLDFAVRELRKSATRSLGWALSFSAQALSSREGAIRAHPLGGRSGERAGHRLSRVGELHCAAGGQPDLQ